MYFYHLIEVGYSNHDKDQWQFHILWMLQGHFIQHICTSKNKQTKQRQINLCIFTFNTSWALFYQIDAYVKLKGK